MLKEINDRVLFYVSCLLLAYFTFLMLDFYVLKLKFVLIGFFRELLTIPSIILLPFVLILAFIRWRKERFLLTGYLFWTIMVLMLTVSGLVLATVYDKPQYTKEYKSL